MLSAELRHLVETGPLAHLATINQDGSPQVSVVWIAIDGEDLVTSHMGRYLKVRNVERDPRVVISLEAPPEDGAFLAPHAVIRATATVEGPTEDAWHLLDRMAKVYLAPDAAFPAPLGAGYILRHRVERVGGVGPWAQ
jgi:PPOX class probable F420-dependent enzyme